MTDEDVATLRPPLIRTAQARGLAMHDAEDLVQDTLVILLDRRPHHLVTYAKRVLVGLLIRRGRTARLEDAAVELVKEGLVRL